MMTAHQTYTAAQLRAEIRAAAASERAKIVAMVRGITTSAGPEVALTIQIIAEMIEEANWNAIAASKEAAARDGLSPLRRQFVRVAADKKYRGQI